MITSAYNFKYLDPSGKIKEINNKLLKKRKKIFMEHQLSTSELLKQYQTDVQTGLSNEKVIEIRNIHGLNELEKKEPESLFEKIKEQFEDILVRLLLISAIISFIISIFSKFLFIFYINSFLFCKIKLDFLLCMRHLFFCSQLKKVINIETKQSNKNKKKTANLNYMVPIK